MTSPKTPFTIGESARRNFRRTERILQELAALEDNDLIAVDVGLAAGGGGTVHSLRDACEVYLRRVTFAYGGALDDQEEQRQELAAEKEKA